MQSTYGRSAFLVMLAISLGGWLLSLVGTICLIWYGRRHSTHRTETLPRVLVACLNFCFGWLLLTFSWISGFDYVHPAVMLLISCILWALTSMLSIFFLFGHWRLTAVESHATTHIGRNSVGTTAKRVVGVCIKNAKTYNLVCFIGYVVCYAIIFVTYGMCYCTNPFQLTTWSSRRDQPKYCLEDEFCHQYVLLGRNSSKVRLVGHVVSFAGTPLSTSAQLCQWDASSMASDCTQLNVTIEGRIVDHRDEIDEDPRFISHISLTGLNASSTYAANVLIVLANGIAIRRVISFRTVPQQRTDLTFISGGDLLSTNEGQWLLFVAFAAQNNPSFITFGGDLSYSNNLRTCYLRFDFFLALVVSLRTSEGLSVPLVILPGNHESGGYLLESDPLTYHFYLPYFPHYDDDAPQSYSTTHHTHDVGQLTLLALDSGLMESCPSQSAYIAERMGSAAALGQTIVAAYHNPMYPSIRDFSDSHSVAVRDAWLPLFLSYNVTLCLEFHDHAYKRTFKVSAAAGVSAANTDGIVFIGDGGLGTERDARSEGTHNYLERFAPVANVQVVHAYANGSLRVTTFDMARNVLDSVSLSSRTNT